MNISVNHLSFRYSRKRPLVLEDFSVSLEAGSIYGLLGPNGAGKSTLLYLIAGFLTPSSGDVSYCNVNTRLRLPSVVADIFLVPEEVDLPGVGLEEYIKLQASFYPHFSPDTLSRCLEAFGISVPGKLNSLSMGQKKKVFLSFALACHTPVLLLDEPTNGLDIPGKAAFRSLVASEMTDDRTIIISTHQVRDLDRLLDRVLIMDNRQLILNSSVFNIQRKIRFAPNIYPCPADALYAIPSPGGFDAMYLNTADSLEEETEVNLELLFDFALRDRRHLSEIFSGNND